MISIIIPNYNGAATLNQCLAAATSLEDQDYEVIVVDDGSEDNSVEIIQKFPCRLIQLDHNSGASTARNTGAKESQGDLLVFTDSDCVLPRDILGRIRSTLDELGPDTILGGTYTIQPFDDRFFSRFQSVYIHYSETKNHQSPDYVATHALVIDAVTFQQSDGFNENFLPILEDVEFSHRLRRLGKHLYIDPAFQVQHIFNYSLFDSLRNAFKKTCYWVRYSLKHNDILADSGTASHELKTNVTCFCLSLVLIIATWLLKTPVILLGIGLVQAMNILINRKLLGVFYDANGLLFTLGASLYYLFIYPVPVVMGIVTGVMQFYTNKDE